MCSPAVSGGLLYVVDSDGSIASHVYALDAANGAERWKFAIMDDSSPVVSGGTVYVGDVYPYLYALAPRPSLLYG